MEEDDARAVEAAITYVLAGDFKNRRFVAAGREYNTGFYPHRHLPFQPGAPPPHTAFHDPSFADAKQRSSIEFRTVAFFE